MKRVRWEKQLMAAAVSLVLLGGCGFEKSSDHSNIDNNPAVDSDRDGISDGAERENGLDPYNPMTNPGELDSHSGSWLEKYPEFAYLIAAGLTSIPKLLTGKAGTPGKVGSAGECSPVITDGTMTIDDKMIITKLESNGQCEGTKFHSEVKDLQITTNGPNHAFLNFANDSATISKKEANISVTVSGEVNVVMDKTEVKGSVRLPIPIPPKQITGDKNRIDIEIYFSNNEKQIDLYNPLPSTRMQWRGLTNDTEWQCWERTVPTSVTCTHNVATGYTSDCYKGEWAYKGVWQSPTGKCSLEK